MTSRGWRLKTQRDRLSAVRNRYAARRAREDVSVQMTRAYWHRGMEYCKARAAELSPGEQSPSPDIFRDGTPVMWSAQAWRAEAALCSGYASQQEPKYTTPIKYDDVTAEEALAIGDRVARLDSGLGTCEDHADKWLYVESRVRTVDSDCATLTARLLCLPPALIFQAQREQNTAFIAALKGLKRRSISQHPPPLEYRPQVQTTAPNA